MSVSPVCSCLSCPGHASVGAEPSACGFYPSSSMTWRAPQIPDTGPNKGVRQLVSGSVVIVAGCSSGSGTRRPAAEHGW
jgi:hypothetical protein